MPESSSKNHLPLYFLLLAFPFLAFWQIGLMQQVMKWDMLDQFFPFRYFLNECLHARIMPAWNPYQHLGWPFHADPQSGFWYPVAWLLALVRGYDIYTMNFEFILHVAIAGAGFFTLLKGFGIESKTALLFSFAYQCCGIAVNNAQHLTWIVALAWLPFVVHFYFSMRDTAQWKHAVAAGFCMMLMLTGGYPVFTIITIYFTGVVFLLHVFTLLKEKQMRQLKKAVALNLLLFVVFAVLSSGYLISFYSALPHFSRSVGLTLEKAQEGALPLKALVSLLLPFATTKNEPAFGADLSMLNVYMGLVPFLFALAGVFYLKNFRVRLFALFGLVCLLAALGDATPVRALLYHYLPAMDKFRFPSIFRTFSVFSFLIVGAIAFQQSVVRWNALRRYFFTAALFMAVAVLGLHFLSLEKAEHFVKFPSLFNVQEYLGFFEKSNLQQRIAIQSLTQCALLLLAAGVFLRVKNQVKLVTALLCLTAADLFLSVQFNLPATAISEVKARDFQRQLAALPQGFPVPARIPVSDVSVYDKRFYPSWHNQNIFTKQPAAQGFNSFQLTAFANFYDSSKRDSVLKHPVVFTAPESPSMQVMLFEPGKIEARTSSANALQLTVLQSSYPGWRVFVDDKPTHFEVSGIPFMRVAVPSGEHLVKIVYKPAYLIPSMLVAAVGFLLAIICLIFAFRRY